MCHLLMLPISDYTDIWSCRELQKDGCLCALHHLALPSLHACALLACRTVTCVQCPAWVSHGLGLAPCDRSRFTVSHNRARMPKFSVRWSAFTKLLVPTLITCIPDATGADVNCDVRHSYHLMNKSIQCVHLR